MKNNLPTEKPHDHYLVLIDGKTASEHLCFVEALEIGSKLRQQYPHSDVKVRETETSTQAADALH